MTTISALLLRAVHAHQAGELDTAAQLYESVLALDPANADALNLLGVMTAGRGRPAEAVAFYDRALAANPAFTEAAFNRASALAALGDAAGAEAGFHGALACDAAHIGARLNLGALLYKSNRKDEAEEQFREMMTRAPDDARAHYNLGRCLLDRARYDAAETALDRALTLDPAGVPQRLTLSDLYIATGRPDRARRLLEETRALHPNAPDVLTALATAVCNTGDNTGGLALYDRALAADPAYVHAVINRGLTLLTLGRLGEGWQGYARRFESGAAMFAPRAQATPWPQWQGEALAGKTIFIWGEQAVGDQILYAGMIPDVIARAGRCVVECAPRLAALFKRSFPKAVVVGPGESAAALARESVDFHSSSLDLGRWLRPSFGSFPNRAAFLCPDAALTAYFKEKYAPLRAGGRRLIGISWRSTSTVTGGDKTIPLAQWKQTLATPGISFLSVQYGDQAEEVAAAPGAGAVLHRDADVDPLGDLDQYAAQLAALDGVISVSNTTVHVAGALGVPAWVLVPHGRGALWYWFAAGDHSPWYPSLRLFRQRSDVNILDEVAAALVSQEF
jgi:tetratricopeptide (TPR) repeat protein